VDKTPRAIGLTTQEMSMVFWVISLVMAMVVINYCLDLYSQIAPINPGIGTLLMFMLFICIFGKIFDFIAMAIPNYKISKENLNWFIDKISNPDYMGWIRFTKNKKLRIQIVKCGPLGQTKGLAYGDKADVINTGDYTVTNSVGNQAIIINDLLSTNVNLNEALGLNLIQKHYGTIGFNAYERCVDQDKLLFKTKKKLFSKKPEETPADG